MKLPRVSILSLMAVVLVVALNGVAIRSIAARHDLLGEASATPLFTLPMANLLAIAAAVRSRSGGRRRVFVLGFEVLGWSLVAATVVGIMPIVLGVEVAIQRLDLASWVEASRLRRDGFAFTLIFAFLVLQTLIALIGGRIALAIGSRVRKSPDDDPPPSRPDLAPLLWLVGIIVILTGGIELYLRFRIEPGFERFERGSIARLKIGDDPNFSHHFSTASSQFALDGSRVRVESDTARSFLVTTNVGKPDEVRRDHRPVRFTVLEGDRKGEEMELPHCLLHPPHANPAR